ncbi:hypothetical protein BJF85_11865 [Saccharomonospora sp. CUA-673]|uniref:DedA family protein n=1 Tax=Saccharomonospora sp. CUA-673 TaxID=1904969 RepID=UPI00095E9ED4|nr:DedA family protein [Saccharomonospora sp. CUA-673]OLT48797.1 hypothetical protein BJF85_11865 [Saccharomonospora sp. CUA-673]
MFVFDALNDLASLLQSHLNDPWLWLLVFLFAGVDALLPFMPSEATVITLAVLLGPGDLTGLLTLVVVSALGAWTGDCCGHWLGRTFGTRATARLLRKERGRRNYEWATKKLHRHAVVLIIAGRYIPGGRAASALATGTLRYPFGKFALLALIGTTLWSIYAVLIGAAGAATFADDPVAGLVVASAVGLLLTVLIEVGRRLVSRHARQRQQRRELRAVPDGVRRPQHSVSQGGTDGGP